MNLKLFLFNKKSLKCQAENEEVGTYSYYAGPSRYHRPTISTKDLKALISISYRD